MSHSEDLRRFELYTRVQQLLASMVVMHDEVLNLMAGDPCPGSSELQKQMDLASTLLQKSLVESASVLKEIRCGQTPTTAEADPESGAPSCNEDDGWQQSTSH